VGSIRVTDTRTWSRGGGACPDGDERRFLVGDDQDDEEDGDERLRSQPLHGKRESGLERGRQGVMGNPSAQLSRLDVHVSNGDVSGEDEVHDNVSGGGLSAKAGIILVRHLTLRGTSTDPITLKRNG
jgi:solute carrier family 45 protein 1/2/4